MDELLDTFVYLSSLLPSCRLYAVGGTSRDYLLKRPFSDFDFACSLTPDEMKPYLQGMKVNMAFSHLGIVEFKYKGRDITLASFRLESDYEDSRHPKKIEFIKDPLIDSKRRDFTINAIYLDSSLVPFDPQNGLSDLKEKTIRMIGDIPQRISEDPLRILRAYRFSSSLGFRIEENLENYLEKNIQKVYELKSQKIEEELAKCTPEGKERIKRLLGGFSRC
jgi:tRNA nucleotidyltransferase (CCA-adding enzyme)